MNFLIRKSVLVSVSDHKVNINECIVTQGKAAKMI